MPAELTRASFQPKESRCNPERVREEALRAVERELVDDVDEEKRDVQWAPLSERTTFFSARSAEVVLPFGRAPS